MFDENAEDLTPISRLGEFGLIEHLTREFENHNPDVVKGIGDDAAVYAVSEKEVHLVTTDLLIEGVHFDLRYVPLKHLGYKSVVVNLSDIYAMNGKPFAITMSVALSSKFTVEAMDAFYEGVQIACDHYDVDLIGGDTSSSRVGMVISVTAIGKAAKADVVYRSGAKEHDLICISGDVGGAYAGLQVLEREKAVFLKNPGVQPDLVGRDYVVGRQLKPEARGDVVRLLRENGIKPTAMIDLSDGLASDLLHICKQSKKGATIYEDKIMIDHEVILVGEDLGIPALTMALNGGEDYELLFTVSLEHYDKIKTMKGVTIIGHIVEEIAGVNLITANGSMLPLQAQGWNHFKD
ncbi:MAG: thiamine-phosphate kinase [Bacteroidetes bacterium]|nr:thiamine-phosphate kinase [Bacteroidota bacterium]